MMEDITNLNCKTFICKKVFVFSILFLALLVLLPTISAATFDNVKGDLKFGDGISEYGKITIRNWFGLSSLTELELKENTDKCGSSCSAETEIIMHQDGILIDSIRFLELQNDESWIEQSIESYKFYIKTGAEEYDVNDYETICELKDKLTPEGFPIKDCSEVLVGTHKETRDLWEEYNLGDEVKAGTYYIKLDGEKDIRATVDWQITSQGKLIDEWATWDSSWDEFLMLVYGFEDTIGTVIEEQRFAANNGTAVSGANTNSTDCVVGSCMYLNGTGTSGYFKISDYAGISAMNNLTVMGWFKFLGTVPTNANIFQKMTAETDQAEFGFTKVGAEQYLRMYNVLTGGDFYIRWSNSTFGNHRLYNGSWHHLAVTYNGNLTASGVRVYVDGNRIMQTPYAAGSFDGTNDGTADFLIGKSTQASDNYWGGVLDEVMIFNASLSNETINDIYDFNLAGGSFGSGAEFVTTLNSPDDDHISSSNTITFNCSGEATTSETVVNISLWTNMSGSWVLNETEDFTVGGGTKNTSIFVKNISAGSVDWTCRGFDTDGQSAWGVNRTFTIDSTYPSINITYPTGTIDYGKSGGNLTLNWTVSDTNLDTCWYSYNNTNTTVTCNDLNTTFVIDNSWSNITIFSNDTANNINSSFTEWVYRIFLNSETYNTIAYETASETYLIDVTANSSLTAVNLIYNGTSYAATKSGNNWSKTFDIPTTTGFGNKTFYWNFTYTGSRITSSTNDQTIRNITFGLCNASNPTAFINFSFKDEKTNTLLNASSDLATWSYWLGSGTQTKSLLYTNTTENDNYAFCFTPADKTLHNNLTFQYASSGYPQRIHVRSTDLTNGTTNQTLYLLASADGIYSSIQVQDVNARSVSGVTIQVERQFSGVWTIIGQDETDASGLATFWVNPDYDHRFTAVKTGYTSVQAIIRPTQSTYTIILSGGVTTTEYTFEGIIFDTYPPSGVLAPNTNYTFTFNITASKSNLVNCKLEIRNKTFSILTSVTGCSAAGGNISLSFNTSSHQKLFGHYYVDVGVGYQLLKSNDAWMVENISFTGGGTGASFWRAMQDFVDWEEFGETENRREFSRITFFFIALTIGLGLFSFFTGFEGTNPGGMLLILWGIIGIFSIGGLFVVEGITRNVWLSKYVLFLCCSFLTWGFLINHWRRNTA